MKEVQLNWTGQEKFGLNYCVFFDKVKAGLSPSKKNCVICFNKSPLKFMKNAFYFILKAIFVLKIFKFFS